ncbi:MAG: gluconeogenesis factor YvcK family protein [Anaerolineales bacterium]|nr:gluconeogenesis factor YvcK family protein [Anaerolineales bacterium]
MNLNDSQNNQPWNRRLAKNIQDILRWLHPGLGVKRWVLVVFIGTTFLAMGFALFVLDVYRQSPDTWWLPILSAASLQTLPRLVRIIIFVLLGVGGLSVGIININRSILGPFIRPGSQVVDSLERHRAKKQGPNIVTVGGGHGLATLLRGLKLVTRNLTAVVSVADDGGSSGRIRETLGILPPGDVRNCLAALSNDEELLTQLFQYRFSQGNGSLEGHSFGNLFISVLADITGSFENAIAESGRVLAVYGRVIPSTLENLVLTADIAEADSGKTIRVEGESQIPEVEGVIKRVMLKPEKPAANPQAIQAILQADMIVTGPGSLYTSILPNLLVPDISAAMRSTQALKVFVCNLATQKGETEKFTCGDHLQVIENHLRGGLFDIVVVNDMPPQQFNSRVKGVEIDPQLSVKYNVYAADLVDREFPWRHDSSRLTEVLVDLLAERTGPLII